MYRHQYATSKITNNTGLIHTAPASTAILRNISIKKGNGFSQLAAVWCYSSKTIQLSATEMLLQQEDDIQGGQKKVSYYQIIKKRIKSY